METLAQWHHWILRRLHLYLFPLIVMGESNFFSLLPVSLFTPGHHSVPKSFDMRFPETHQLAYSHGSNCASCQTKTD